MDQLIYSDDNGNKVYGKPKRIIGKYRFKFHGENSQIIIGKGCTFKNLIINVKGSNNLVSIGENCKIYGEILTAHLDNKIIIGNKLKCNGACRFHASEGRTIRIGNDCLFSNVRFRTSDSHSMISLDTQKRINPAADIIVGNKVWIAEDVYIYKGVNIGEGSVIGARSTVTKNLPEYALCVGSPAIPVKKGITWHEKLL